MGAPARGDVVLVTFPFTDLTGGKLRPAVVLAAGDHSGDFILCQITSQNYGDREAIAINPVNDFKTGTLLKPSFARPRKLFTASMTLIRRTLGSLNSGKLDEIARSIVAAISGTT